MNTLSTLLTLVALIPALTLVWITTVAATRAKGNIWLATQIELSVIITIPLLYAVAAVIGGALYLLLGEMGFYAGFALALAATQAYLLGSGFALR
jgi:hypothetical protein